jgi:hypothetical protein
MFTNSMSIDRSIANVYRRLTMQILDIGVSHIGIACDRVTLGLLHLVQVYEKSG